jgi:hypothetical protein
MRNLCIQEQVRQIAGDRMSLLVVAVLCTLGDLQE